MGHQQKHASYGTELGGEDSNTTCPAKHVSRIGINLIPIGLVPSNGVHRAFMPLLLETIQTYLQHHLNSK